MLTKGQRLAVTKVAHDALHQMPFVIIANKFKLEHGDVSPSDEAELSRIKDEFAALLVRFVEMNMKPNKS